MLADDVLANVGTIIDSPETNFMISRYAEALLECQRFILSPDVVKAAEALLHTNPSNLLKALPFCKLPFNSCWFEWPSSYRRSYSNTPLAPNEVVPPRIGVLVTCSDDTHQRFSASFCWNTRTDISGCNVNICPASIRVDWAHSLPRRNAALVLHPARGHNLFDPTNEEQLAAARQLHTHYDQEISSYFDWMHDRLTSDHLTQASRDLEGEHLFFQCVIALLNAKNCIATSPVDPPEKLQRSRLKRGKRPLVSYSNVTITLSAADIGRAQRSGLSEIEIRRHVVRGHFKIRRTGVYWWRPFLRGSKAHGEVRRESYQITQPGRNAAPPAE